MVIYKDHISGRRCHYALLKLVTANHFLPKHVVFVSGCNVVLTDWNINFYFIKQRPFFSLKKGDFLFQYVDFVLHNLSSVLHLSGCKSTTKCQTQLVSVSTVWLHLSLGLEMISCYTARISENGRDES